MRPDAVYFIEENLDVETQGYLSVLLVFSLRRLAVRAAHAHVAAFGQLVSDFVAGAAATLSCCAVPCDYVDHSE